MEEDAVLCTLNRDLTDEGVTKRPTVRFQLFKSETVRTLRVGVHPRQLSTASEWLFDGLKRRFQGVRLLQLAIGGETARTALQEAELAYHAEEKTPKATQVNSEAEKQHNEAENNNFAKQPQQGEDEEIFANCIWYKRNEVDLSLWKGSALPRVGRDKWEQQWRWPKLDEVELEILCMQVFESAPYV